MNQHSKQGGQKPLNKDKQSVHFSSQRLDWSTPQGVFDELNEEFNFTLDPCASDETAKCSKYYTKEDDGLAQSWSGESVFMNPPLRQRNRCMG